MRIQTFVAMIAGSAALGTGSPALAHGYPDHGLSGYISISSGSYYGPHVAGNIGFGNVVYIPPRPAYYDHAYFYPGCGHWHQPSHYHARLYAPYRVHHYGHPGGWKHRGQGHRHHDNWSHDVGYSDRHYRHDRDD